MINVSNEIKDLMTEDNRKFLSYLDIVLADGTKLPTIENDDLWDGGFKIDDGVTASGQFTVGSCIINKLTITINNIYDKFSTYDFDGAVVTVYLGLELSGGRIEKIRKGIFTVDEPTYNGSTITLECLDNMHKLDRDYADVKTSYPATLGTIVRDICSMCGVTLLTTAFSNSSYVIQKRPTDDALTCRQVLSYAAQLACCFARCDTYGRLVLKWFEQGVFENGSNLDGGFLDDGTPSYISGDKADGGTFNPWNTGYVADAGTFEEQNKFHHLYHYSSLSVSTDDIVITGVQVTDEREETEKDKKQTYLYGNKGYVLSISGNRFVEKGKAQTVAAYLGQKLVGLRFRQMSGQFLSDPTVEAGDLAYVTDRKQRTYNCLVTNLTFAIGNYMSVTCDAETPSKNSETRYSEMTQAIVEARKNTRAQISDYDLAVQQLTDLMTNCFGVYKTEEKQPDNSFIFYMHNKPTRAESTTIWKMTADAFAVSTDGGKTWNAGIDSSGNAVVNVLSAIGINFDWAKGGTLTLGGNNNIHGEMRILDASGNEIGRWGRNGINITKGNIQGPSITLGGENNKNGVLVIQDADGNEIGRWSRWGLTAKKGTFSGSLDAAGGTFSGKMITGSDNSDRVEILSKSIHLYGAPPPSGGIAWETLELVRIVNASYSDYFRGKIVVKGTGQGTEINGGTITCKTLTQSSDERLKENIQQSDTDALSVINSLMTYDYDWIETGEHEKMALIAQQMELCDPDFVEENEVTGVKCINQIKLIPYLVKSVQELSSIVNKQQSELVAVRNRLSKLESPDAYYEEVTEECVGMGDPDALNWTSGFSASEKASFIDNVKRMEALEEEKYKEEQQDGDSE